MLTFLSFRARSLLLILFVLYLFQLYSIQAASITPNYKSSCALLSNRIYCYSGGYAALGDIVIKRALDEHHYLDLTQNLVLDETSAKWVSVPDDPNYMNEPALAGTGTAISGTAYVMDGGYNGTPFVKNVTRLFDSITNTWKTIPNDNRMSMSYTDIYMGTAVEVPNKGRIYYWGGLSGQYPGYPVNTTTVLSMQSPKFTWSICPGTLPLGSYTRFGHTATLDNGGINIFYIGGRIRTIVSTTDDIPTNDNSTLVPYNIIPMTKILTYNTMDATWTSRQSPSAPTMSNRYMHTANLLPYSGKILIYGGATDDGNEKHPSAVSDYLYLFDPNTLEYTRMQEYESSLGAGPRFGHSAILCNNTLFVLFGVNQIGLITNEVYFLSLTGSATWLKSFSLLSSISNSNNDTSNHHPINSITNQAIIGITIALVLVIVLTVGGILYGIHYWRKKKSNSSKLEEEEGNMKKEDEKIQDLPQLHRQYHKRYSTATLMNNEEDHQPRSNNNSSPNEYELYNNNDSATLHDNHTPPRGFSFDHLTVVHHHHHQKPNQVKDQQPLTFIEGQQQQSSTSSFYLQPTTPTATTPTATTPISFLTTTTEPLVKPSL